MMRALVTGGAGFIGYHLVRRLLSENYEVLVVDNFTLGKKENVNEFINNNKYKFINFDIDNIDAFCETLKDEKIDIIYHLAANSDIQKGGKNPKVDYDNTFNTTFSVLELMRRNKIDNLFFSSTSAVYGERINENLSENLGGLKPISYYGSAKLASEAFISSYQHMNDLNVMIFRFPNVIGPGLTHGVIYDFKNKLEKNSHELEILGDGTQTKPYVYVDDLIDVIMLMTKNIPNGLSVYNVGVDSATSVKTIADILCDELGYADVIYKYTGGNIGWKGDVPKFQFDLSKIHDMGWHSTRTSNQAVRDTIKSLKKTK